MVYLDATPTMLTVGEREARKQEIDNMEFINSHVEEIPFDDQSFEIVYRLVFVHIDKMDKSILNKDGSCLWASAVIRMPFKIDNYRQIFA